MDTFEVSVSISGYFWKVSVGYLYPDTFSEMTKYLHLCLDTFKRARIRIWIHLEYRCPSLFSIWLVKFPWVLKPLWNHKLYDSPCQLTLGSQLMTIYKLFLCWETWLIRLSILTFIWYKIYRSKYRVLQSEEVNLPLVIKSLDVKLGKLFPAPLQFLSGWSWVDFMWGFH